MDFSVYEPQERVKKKRGLLRLRAVEKMQKNGTTVVVNGTSGKGEVVLLSRAWG